MKKRKTELEEELRLFYEAPAPAERAAFLDKLGKSGISMAEFLWIQAGYIQKWTYAAGIGIFLLILGAVWGAEHVEQQLLWAVSACVPVLSMGAVTEGRRSRYYGMEELELAAPFSLKAVMAARTGILGLANFLILIVGFPAVKGWQGESLVYTGVFVLIPYLFSAFLNLYISRKIHGKEALYLCCGATALISGGYMAVYMMELSPAAAAAWLKWELILPALAVLVGREWYKTMKQSEEYVWSLS